MCEHELDPETVSIESAVAHGFEYEAECRECGETLYGSTATADMGVL